MSALTLTLSLETALYGLLAYVAVAAAIAEKQMGHDRLFRYHRFAALIYALLGTAHLFHI
jgi:predicted ferric reductase